MLLEYAIRHHVGAGWQLLTGAPEDIERVRRKLGFASVNPVRDADVIVAVGARKSNVRRSRTDPLKRMEPFVAPSGVTPMSASRFTVDCRMSALGASEPPSCTESSPHDHCTVPAPKTNALLAARYSVRLWVAVPSP